MSRREFFRAGARYGLLTALAAAAVLAGRSRGTAGQRCVNRGICGGCDRVSTCGLPPALSARRAQQEG